MPIKRAGRTILHKKGDKWRVKAHAKSIASAKRMMRLLRGVAHGWKPSKRRR